MDDLNPSFLPNILGGGSVEPVHMAASDMPQPGAGMPGTGMPFFMNLLQGLAGQGPMAAMGRMLPGILGDPNTGSQLMGHLSAPPAQGPHPRTPQPSQATFSNALAPSPAQLSLGARQAPKPLSASIFGA